MPRKVTKDELEPFVEFVKEINEDIIRRFGGAKGRVNEGNLAYQLYNSLRKARKKPKSKFYACWAASALEGISQSHPFIDGNKRTAYVICRLILLVDNNKFGVNYDQAEKFIIKIAKRKANYQQIEKWVEKNAVKKKMLFIDNEIEKYISLLKKIIKHERGKNE